MSIKLVRFIIVCLFSYSGLLQAADIKIGGGDKAGVYNPTIQAICDLGKASANSCEVVVGKGSLENLNAILAGKLDFAVVQSDIVYQAYTGTGLYKDNKQDNLRAVMAIYPELLALVVSANSDIKVLQDVRGKTISLGGEGSGSAATADRLLTEAGLTAADYSVKNLLPAQAANALAAGEIGAYFYMVGHPAKNIQDAAKQGIRLLFLDGKPVYNMMEKYPYYTQGVIPANLYQGVTEDIPSVGVKAVLLTREDTDAAKVTQLVDTVVTHFNDFSQHYPDKSQAKLESLLHGLSAPLHPAAKSYYQAKGLVEK